jgi:hypothetical protein
VQNLEQAWSRNKSVEKDLLCAAGKESTGVISKTMPPKLRECGNFILGTYTYSHRKAL